MPDRASDVAEPLPAGLAHHRDLRGVRRRRRECQTSCASGRANGLRPWPCRDPGRGPLRMPRHAGQKRSRRQAARNGLWSALLAAQGLAGPAEPLTGSQGYFHALAESPQLSVLTCGLGEGWEIMKTAFKPYPCGFVVHPVLDCVIDWRRAHPNAIVEKVTVTGNPLLAARTDRPKISTSGQSQVSVQHAVAAALVTGKAGVEQFGET